MEQQYQYLTDDAINHFIDEALREDVGDGDHTSLASIPEGMKSKAQLIVKDNGVIAGVTMAKKIFHRIDSSLTVEYFVVEGQEVAKGDIAFIVTGAVHSILKAERLVLNCMQRMSGIATLTRAYCNAIAGTKAQLLDTRKTTPNFRIAEKWAVAIGGGTNHRYGLFDMILLKDNHADYAGGTAQAIRSAKAYLKQTGKNLKIEIEVRNQQELQEALNEGGIERIMLDNMTTEQMTSAVALVNGSYTLEASGGVTLETIKSIAETGVDFISVGALTHSIKSIDMSLKAIK